jgi:hypothetical protein
MPVYRAVLAFGAAVLMVGMFATGYLATSAVARVLIPIRTWWVYPLILAVVFSIHLEILFIAMGGTGWTRGEQMVVRAGGACIVFVVALCGNAVLWWWANQPRRAGV